MSSRSTLVLRATLFASASAVLACSEAAGPNRDRPGLPAFALDQQNGSFGESGRMLIKGFNSTNPHVGDAIVVTFFWIGSTNIIDSVTDVLTLPGYPSVGNKYNLVEYVTGGGVSMATYVAFNVQGFPDAYNAPAQDSILAVRANLSDSVVGGISMYAFTGVASVTAQALGAHRSATGTGSSETVASAGAIAVNAGSHVYAVTTSNALVGVSSPAGFSRNAQSDSHLVGVDGYEIVGNSGSVDPQWDWFFNQPSTWLATVLALNPAPPPEPIAADQSTGSFSENGTMLGMGFSTNPRVGDAIVATFSWVGSTNIIDSVTDHLSAAGYPSVGNTYRLVEYTTSGGISMATYVATNAQGFPGGFTGGGGDSLLVVHAHLASAVSNGGVALTAYSGVAPTFLHALGAHGSAIGSGSTTTTAQAGSIAIGAGSLGYTATLSNGLVALEAPAGYTNFIQTDNTFKGGAAFAVQGSAGTINPAWTWSFNAPSTWLASVLALNGR
jgi:hypothetical protein